MGGVEGGRGVGVWGRGGGVGGGGGGGELCPIMPSLVPPVVWTLQHLK